MPTYNFFNTKTEESFTEFMKISELDDYLKNNPHITQEPSSPAIGDPFALGRSQVPSGFRDVLQKIKKGNRGNTINTGNLTAI